MKIETRRNTIAAWTELIRASERALSRIEAALSEAGLPSLSWYDALLEIEKAGADGIRPYTLKDRLLMPQYGTSRLLGRIMRAGYIQRVACDRDGRGHVVKITDAGIVVRKRMWPIYRQCLIDMFEAQIDEDEADILVNLLRRVGTITETNDDT
jgi:DNA-binding MarR family transcriptional regulator